MTLELLNEYEHNVNGDCWIKHNGKVRVWIIFDTTGKMTKISLHLENYSKHMKFYEGYKHKAIHHSTLKNKESIEKRVKLYKEEAEKLMEEHQFPTYCEEKQNFDILKKLLHIPEVS